MGSNNEPNKNACLSGPFASVLVTGEGILNADMSKPFSFKEDNKALVDYLGDLVTDANAIASNIPWGDAVELGTAYQFTFDDYPFVIVFNTDEKLGEGNGEESISRDDIDCSQDGDSCKLTIKCGKTDSTSTEPTTKEPSPTEQSSTTAADEASTSTAADEASTSTAADEATKPN